ncbi:MAG: hypothetical protein HZA01_04720 [Nitrospinae bacterium]|nr:hypothetical protein [Nitrospinota bacterium]
MFPDETKSKVVIDYLKRTFPDADINYRIDMYTFSYEFRLDHGNVLQILIVERSFVDDRAPQVIYSYLDSNDICNQFKKHNVQNIFVSNNGISIKYL